MVYSPPAGFTDALSDAENSPNQAGFHPLEVPGVDTFLCRKPMANAVGAIGNAVNSKISEEERNNYIGLFVRNHLSEDAWDQLTEGMMRGRYPSNAVGEVCRAISTWGTARPTRRSSISRI